ncbi:MAG: DUF4388 domain-containing protein [Candidatus Competibacteraceae bacterium]|nr:DUF4388 domain-containing protein [Candidatus Competibacteraceae bacterium]
MFQKSLSLPAIAAQLRKLCQEKQTGILHIIDKGHLLGQISLEKGDIVSLLARKQHGIDALPILLEVETGDIAFASSPLSTPRMSLPSTVDILAILEQVKPATTLSQSNVQASQLSLTAASKTILEQTLKEFIGPIANMICADHFRVATTLAATIDALANDIPNPQAATQFRERVRQRLNS